MIYINNAKKKIGPEGLIINLKANNFYQTKGLRPDDFHKLYEIYTKFDSNITLSPPLKQNIFLCVLYYESNYNEEAKKKLYEININNIINKDLTKEEKLYILFNIIEIEIKIRKKNEKELFFLFTELQKINIDKKFFDTYLLQKHYLAYLKFLQGDYDFTDEYTIDIINEMDANEELKKGNLINYLRIRNEVLKAKILELKDPEKNYKEIISHLDGLFSMMKNTKEDFAICVGIKMLSLQSKEIVSFEECIKLIQEMLDVLKRETLFGKSHKNILEQYLYLSGLLGYYSAINDDTQGIKKATEKIDKYLSDVQEIINEQKKNNNEIKNSIGEKIRYDNLYLQYSYFNTMLKSSIDFSKLKESQNKINDIQGKMSNKNDIDILNICVLEREDLTKSTQLKKLEELFNEWTGQNLDLKNDKIILIYFYLYNKISSLTKNLMNKMKLEPNKNFEEIRNLVTKIIETTKKQVEQYNNDLLKKIFKLPFFKNLFNRLYYVRIYSYYLEGKYKDCLDAYFQYDKNAKFQYELETPKSNEYMKKIEGDCYFKLKDFKKAEEVYGKIINIGTNDPLIYFNLGLTLYFKNDKDNAITQLEKALDYYRKENNNTKVKTINELIDKIKGEKGEKK